MLPLANLTVFFEIMPWSFTRRKNRKANTVWAGGTIFGLILCSALNIQLTFLLPQFNPTQELKRNKKDFAFTINCGKGQHWRRLQRLKFVLRITIFCKLAYRMNIFFAKYCSWFYSANLLTRWILLQIIEPDVIL